MSTDSEIYVTRPDLPPLPEFTAMLEQIWASRQLTNGGPMHEQLEQALAEYLEVPYVCLTANGTLPLMLALRALGIESGEVITTPYSFVATAHALQWSGLEPIFADICADGFGIDPESVARLVTPRTRAILGVHVYGMPCKCEALQQVADAYGLPLIYDAAHAFGGTYKGESLLRQGDISTLSFHATKVFNTIEGGALICHSAEMKERVDRLKNFGFAGETSIIGIGINAKLDEVRSAYGLASLRYIDAAIDRRQHLHDLYTALLRDTPGITLPEVPATGRHNFSYYPILIESSYPISRDGLYHKLREQGIYPRRYFYPLITDFEPYASLLAGQTDGDISNARRAAERVLCLPLYPDLAEDDVKRIADIIRGCGR